MNEEKKEYTNAELVARIQWFYGILRNKIDSTEPYQKSEEAYEMLLNEYHEAFEDIIYK
jgi:hypothetical protein